MAARYDLAGKSALVTGGARGIGFATAKALAARGAAVTIVDLDPAAAEAAAAQVHDTRALGIGADVTDSAAMQRAVATAVERFGGLDVVVANAGIASTPATYRATAVETFERVIEVNLLGVHRTVAAALPQIVDRGGHVVVIASVYAFFNGVGSPAYAMAKAGVEQFGRALRVELVPHGASASVAYFGFIDTEMVRRALDADPLGDKLTERIPRLLRKRLQPSVAGEAIVRGIERRQPRIIRPRRWTVLSILRGILNPLLDAAMERDAKLLEIVREFDDRADVDQQTTA
jgi:NAD(P)-dependent dehydrogenase (short-subunit alcohol dehydrogenase family)